MELIFSAVIPIKAVPKERPRMGRGFAFTPKRTRDFEKLFRGYLSSAYKNKPVSCAVKIRLAFYFARPNKPAHNYPSRFDIDNIAKAVLDASNQILYDDDTQVTELVALKQFGMLDEISISMWGLTDSDCVRLPVA